MNNDANNYTGATRLNCATQASGNLNFTSLRNLGEASSLGAPTTVTDGTITFGGGSQYSDRVTYIGSGDSSNRNWIMKSGQQRRLLNDRKSVVKGKSVEVRVKPGGRRNINKKKKKNT